MSRSDKRGRMRHQKLAAVRLTDEVEWVSSHFRWIFHAHSSRRCRSSLKKQQAASAISGVQLVKEASFDSSQTRHLAVLGVEKQKKMKKKRVLPTTNGKLFQVHASKFKPNPSNHLSPSLAYVCTAYHASPWRLQIHVQLSLYAVRTTPCHGPFYAAPPPNPTTPARYGVPSSFVPWRWCRTALCSYIPGRDWGLLRYTRLLHSSPASWTYSQGLYLPSTSPGVHVYGRIGTRLSSNTFFAIYGFLYPTSITTN